MLSVIFSMKSFGPAPSQAVTGLFFGKLSGEGAALRSAAAIFRPFERETRRVHFLAAPPSEWRARVLRRQCNFAEIRFANWMSALVQEAHSLRGRHPRLIVARLPFREHQGCRRCSIKVRQGDSPSVMMMENALVYQPLEGAQSGCVCT